MEKYNNQFRDSTKKVRLIDANRTEEKVKFSDKPAWMVVRDMPTVDAVKAVYGQWDDDPYDPRFICSECGAWFLVENSSGYMNYCPNCGADMRERETDES